MATFTSPHNHQNPPRQNLTAAGPLLTLLQLIKNLQFVLVFERLKLKIAQSE
jgi:hypothetical protein